LDKKESLGQKYEKCVALDSMLFENPYSWKPIFLFNENVFVPIRQEGLVELLTNAQNRGCLNLFNEVFQFDNHYLYDSFSSQEQQSLLAWRWLLYLELPLKRIMRERLSNLEIDIKALLRECYPERSLPDELTFEDALDYAAGKAREVAVGSALAYSKGSTLVCDEFMSLLSTLPIFGKLDTSLRDESIFGRVRPSASNIESLPVDDATRILLKQPKNTTPEFEGPYKIVQDFLDSNIVKKSANSLPFVFRKKIPDIHNLSFDQISKLRSTNKISSLYSWLFRRATEKGFDVTTAEPGEIAGFLQDAMWELVTSIKPNLPETIATMVISQIPIPLPINPVGVALEVKNLLKVKKFNDKFEGLFILSSLRQRTNELV
jgi:hypothetical protein